jgi:phosphohistidine phosphatase SixA
MLSNIYLTNIWGRLFFLVASILSSNAFASSTQLSSLLNGTEYVLMMRHADAPGYSDPSGFNVKDCSSQRNLGDVGKRQAYDIGQWLKSQGINDARILSSPWCRCIDTATLLNLGKVNLENSLSSFFENRANEKQQTLLLQKKIQEELFTKNNKPLILVTHQVNIQAFTGEGVSSGQMVLVQVTSKGKYVSHQLIKLD